MRSWTKTVAVGMGRRLRFERDSDLLKINTERTWGLEGERQERMTPEFLTWVTRQPMAPLTEMRSIEGGEGFGENVTNTVDGLTCHPILHPI